MNALIDDGCQKSNKARCQGVENDRGNERFTMQRLGIHKGRTSEMMYEQRQGEANDWFVGSCR